MPIAAADPFELGLHGYEVRALGPGDAHDVFELMAQSELEVIGEVSIEEADIIADWQRPSFDLARQSVGVFDADRLVGYAEVYLGRWADTGVALEHRGHGIGTALALWTQRVSRRDGQGLIGMPVPAGSPGERLMRALGYTVAWTSWVLEMPPGHSVRAQTLPTGYAIRSADGESDYRSAHRVVDKAFLEWSQRDPESYDDFAAGTVLRPGFEPWQFRVARDAGDDIVGVSVIMMNGALGFIAKLAVARDHRGRGLARSLLVDSFAAARDHGSTRFELSTDSRTGALGLYEKVGMRVSSTWRHWAISTVSAREQRQPDGPTPS